MPVAVRSRPATCDMDCAARASPTNACACVIKPSPPAVRLPMARLHAADAAPPALRQARGQ
eukprot:8441259-Alexandrium_andersonii.AAC.1